MKISKTGNIWYSPYSVYKHLQLLADEVGVKAIEKNGKYKVVREARIAAVTAVVLYKITGKPAYIQLPDSDPPDAFIMQQSTEKIGQLDISTLEITSYRANNGSLFEQLKNTKMKKNSGYSDEYILVVELFSNEEIDYDKIRNYANNISLPFPIWTLKGIVVDGTTTAELVIVNPETHFYEIPIADAIAQWHDKNLIDIITTKRTGSEEKVRTESSGNIELSPWKHLIKK